MLDTKVVEKLKEKFSFLPPLLVYRSIERAKSNGDLFDILDTVPEKYPIVWCDKNNRWVSFPELYDNQEFLKEL